MKKTLITALGIGVLGWAAISVPASAQDLSIGIGVGPGPRYYDDGPYPRPRPHYDTRSYVYREPVQRECWIERRWVDGPYGPRPLRVRVCE
jgi:hypothetical protein